MIKLNRIDSVVQGIKTVAISGHVRPDGDSIGSCLGMYHYLNDNFPWLEKVDVYLEAIPECYSIIDGVEVVKHTCEEDIVYDLFLALDCSELDRLGDAAKYFSTAGKTICYDHHISNPGYADENYIDAEISSASEIVYHTMDPEKVSKNAAQAIYMGIVHDSGIFMYSCASPLTMETAAALMRKGFDHTRIIDITYMQKSDKQNRLMSKAILDSELIFDEKCIFTCMDKETLQSYQASHADLGGIVGQLRNTTGVEAAVFFEETGENDYKVSLRSKNYVDVRKVAQTFGGGGHIRAAGCSMKGSYADVSSAILGEIEKQI